MRFISHVHHCRTPLVAALGLALAACASVPSQGPVGLGGAPAAHFNTGRVNLYLTDYEGRPLDRARVDIEGTGDDYFRTAAFSDWSGRVSFAGVPQQIRISVYHAASQGSFTQEYIVPSSGTTDVQMLVETLR